MKGTASGASADHASPTRSIAMRRPSLDHHGSQPPYRIEICGITSVSVSLLWSLRPLPLSALSQSAFRTQGSGSGAQRGAQGAAAKLPSAQARASPIQRIQAEGSTSSSHSSGVSSSVVATRSPNRRVTKVSIRNVSPAQRNQQQTTKSSRGSAQATLKSRRDSSTEWPSEDGATAVGEEEPDSEHLHDDMDADAADRTFDSDHAVGHAISASQDDEAITPSEASDDVVHSTSRSLDSAIAITVNGVPWSQVVVGDNGVEEAFVIIYGLQPLREYDVVLCVDEKQSGISLSTMASAESVGHAVPAVTSVASTEAEEKHQSADGTLTPNNRSVDDRPSPAPSAGGPQRTRRAHTPPMQDTENAAADTSMDAGNTFLPTSAMGTSDPPSATIASIQSAMRKARKDSSRAESALRNEIEAIKRGLDRMSDVDHRSKQKLLALQENIRQATTQAKDIDEEATVVENEREMWEEREKEKNDELEGVRAEVEEKIRISQAQIKGDAEEVSAMEKELEQLTKSIEDKRAAKEKLEKEQLTEAQGRLGRIHEELDLVLKNPSPTQAFANSPTASFYAAAASSQPGAHNQTHIVPAHVQRGGGGRGGAGRGGAGTGVARGGAQRGGYHQTTAQQGGATGRRNAHRHNGRFQGAAFGAGSGQQFSPSASVLPTSEEYNGAYPYNDAPHYASSTASMHSPVTSLLNPNNPEFIPSGNLTGQSMPSASHLAAFHGANPSAALASEYSPTQSRFPFHAYGSDQDAPRRASASHLDIASFPSPSNTTHLAHPTLGANDTSTWLPGTASPWSQPTSNLASSPQIGHDIWRSPASSTHGLSTTSPQMPHSNMQAIGSNGTSSLRTKTSIPFGLNSSILRGGANPSYVHSRLGDTPISSPFVFQSGRSHAASALGAPTSPPQSSSHHNSTIGDGGLGRVSNEPSDDEPAQLGGNSAPVSPIQPDSNMMHHSPFGL